MFSFFSLGRLRGGQIHILNVILASAFLLVLIHPLRLMDIGFQLSYAAITGIVTIHPLLRSVLKLKSRLLRQIWEAGSISLAAQLATAPLIIFYFRQLPVYALVTSLVAIPMLSVLIAVFVCSLPLAALGVLEHVFSFLLVRLAGLMNRSMDFVSSLPGAVLGDLQLDLPELVVWMLILLMALMAMHSRNRYPAYLLLTLISTLQVWNALSCLERRSSAALVIAHFREASMLSYRVGTHVDHYCWKRDSSSLAYMEAFRELAWNRRIYKNRTCELASSGSVSGSISSCCMLREGLWLVGADGLNGLVLTAGLGDRIPGYACRSAYILLSGEPPLECIQELLDLEEMLIVMDGSNPKWYQERIVALRDGIYLTDQAGALVKRW